MYCSVCKQCHEGSGCPHDPKMSIYDEAMGVEKQLKAEIAALKAEATKLRTMSTVEMMCENYNVRRHVEEWEKRCLEAERKVTDNSGLLEYVTHDSWRCAYYQVCHCGLNDLTDKMGLPRVAIPSKEGGK